MLFQSHIIQVQSFSHIFIFWVSYPSQVCQEPFGLVRPLYCIICSQTVQCRQRAPVQNAQILHKMILGFFPIFYFSLGFETDVFHQHFHFVLCSTYKLFQCTFPIFNTRSEITEWVFFLDEAHKTKRTTEMVTRSRNTNSDLEALSKHPILQNTLLVPKHKPPGQVQKTQVYFDQHITFVVKVWQFIPLIPALIPSYWMKCKYTAVALEHILCSHPSLAHSLFCLYHEY